MENLADLESLLDTIVEKPKEKDELKIVSSLSTREAKFIHEYCSSFNKVDAYRKSFYSKEHADEVALKADALLNRPEIERKVKNELSKKLDSKLMTAPHFLMNYIDQVINLDPLDFYEADGVTIKPLDQIPVEKRKFIRVGKPTVNARTGQVFPGYELPTFSSAVDKLLDIVRLVTQTAAKNPGDTGDTEEVRQRRERILNSIGE
jgi:hypothetical protein